MVDRPHPDRVPRPVPSSLAMLRRRRLRSRWSARASWTGVTPASSTPSNPLAMRAGAASHAAGQVDWMIHQMYSPDLHPPGDGSNPSTGGEMESPCAAVSTARHHRAERGAQSGSIGGQDVALNRRERTPTALNVAPTAERPGQGLFHHRGGRCHRRGVRRAHRGRAVRRPVAGGSSSVSEMGGDTADVSGSPGSSRPRHRSSTSMTVRCRSLPVPRVGGLGGIRRHGHPASRKVSWCLRPPSRTAAISAATRAAIPQMR